MVRKLLTFMLRKNCCIQATPTKMVNSHSAEMSLKHDKNLIFIFFTGHFYFLGFTMSEFWARLFKTNDVVS